MPKVTITRNIINKEDPDKNYNRQIARYGLIIAIIVPLMSGLISYLAAIEANKTLFKSKKYEVSFNEKRRIFSEHIEILNEIDSKNLKLDFTTSNLESDFRRYKMFVDAEVKEDSQQSELDTLINMIKRSIVEDKDKLLSNHMDIDKSLDRLQSSSIEFFPFIRKNRYTLQNYTHTISRKYSDILKKDLEKYNLVGIDKLVHIDSISTEKDYKDIEQYRDEYFIFLGDVLHTELFEDE